MRTTTSRRRPTSCTEFDGLIHEMRKHRQRPARTPEERAAWIKQQVEMAMARLGKQGGQ